MSFVSRGITHCVRCGSPLSMNEFNCKSFEMFNKMSKSDIEKQIKDLEEQLENLKKQQIEAISLNADDLWIRDEIAEIEEKIIEKRNLLYE